MCYSIAKFLLFGFNLIFWLGGLVVLSVGIWMAVDPNFQESLASAGMEYAISGAYVFIVAGCIMIIFGFIGCWGAVKESTCFLMTYGVLLFIVLCLEVGIGIWAFVTYDSVGQAVLQGMKNIYGTALNQNDKDKPIYATQHNLQCCGLTGGCTDWESNEAFGCGCDPSFNPGCSISTGCTDPDSSSTGIYTKPCTLAVTAFVENNMVIIGAIGIAIGVIEVFGIIFSCCLTKKIKDDKKRQSV